MISDFSDLVDFFRKYGLWIIVGMVVLFIFAILSYFFGLN